MSIINVNGKSYDNGSVTIAFLGNINLEITEMDYSTDQVHKLNHSLGTYDPTSYSQGNITHKCSIGMRLKSINQIEKAAGASLLLIKPFPIIVTYVNEFNQIITDRILAKFQSNGRKLGTDDDTKFTFEMFTLAIYYNQ